MTLILVTEPAELPITTAEAKRHLVVDSADDDALIDDKIAAATRLAELRTGRQIISATYDYKIDRFCNTIRMPKPPLVSVTSIKYKDQDNVEQTLDSSIYEVEAGSMPGIIRLAYDNEWPDVLLYPEPITIRFVAGYADAASVPQGIKNWIALTVGSLYDLRSSDAAAGTTVHHEFTDSLIDGYDLRDLA